MDAAKGDTPPAGPAITLLDGGREAFPRMLQAIRQARQSVYLEVYHFAREGVGDEFRRALSDAALRGVRVQVVLDGWGSALDGRWLQGMLEPDGAEVRIYHPLSSLWLGRVRRNHRKLLRVDGEVAVLGGINVADEYGVAGPGLAPDLAATSPAWLDLAVEVRGPAAAWLEARLRGERTPRPRDPVQIHLSGIGGGRRLRRLYLRAVGGARREILAAHSYFLPDRRFMRSLTAAARRGVGVTLLLAGRSDVPLSRIGTVRLYRKLLAGGVRIREWTSSVHHAKLAVVDGHRLLLGSFNLDPYSLANLESLVEIDDRATAEAARLWFEERAARAREVVPEEVARGWIFERLVEPLGALVEGFARLVARFLGNR